MLIIHNFIVLKIDPLLKSNTIGETTRKNDEKCREIQNKTDLYLSNETTEQICQI